MNRDLNSTGRHPYPSGPQRGQLSSVNRRGFLNCIPAAMVGITGLPVMANTTDNETPIFRIFREWRAYYEWGEGPATDGMGDEALNAIGAVRREIEDRMFSLPCQNTMDVLAKLVAYTLNGEEFGDDGGAWSGRILQEAKLAVDEALSATAHRPSRT